MRRAGRFPTSLRPAVQQSACRGPKPRVICRAMDCSPRRCSAASPDNLPRSCRRISGGCTAPCSPYRAERRIVMSRSAHARKPQENNIADRVAALHWDAIGTQLDSFGCATTGPLLSADECAATAERYDEDGIYRSRIIMARHGFGRGEYKYFAYPLPETIVALRTSLYSRLADVANRWNEQMGLEPRYPAAHSAWLKRCHAAGQTKPTPLLLQYGPGDYNCLHQD